MTNKTVSVLAKITARPDKIDELISLLLHLVEETRKENGCISYQFLQSRSDPGDFVCVEEWASDCAIDSHLASAHVQDALLKAVPLLAKEPDIKRYGAVE